MFPFELPILQWLERMRTDWGVALMEGITMLGEETILILLIAIVYFAWDKGLARRIFFITVSSLGINNIIKNIVGLPRPFADGKVSCLRPHTATGYSFPSGHTQNVATWTSALAWRLRKNGLWIFSIGFSVLVAISRIYLGAHYPMDVTVGLSLGFGLSALFSLLYDKIKNEHRLHGCAVLAMTPFVVWFAIDAQVLFADLYKIYGMMLGLWLGTLFEERWVNITMQAPVWKRILRVLIGVVVAFLLKEGIKVINPFSAVWLSLLWDALRYFVVVFAVMALCPWLYKKTKL